VKTVKTVMSVPNQKNDIFDYSPFIYFEREDEFLAGT